MSTVAEIEAAIEKLSPAQVEELAAWLEAIRVQHTTPHAMERWLERARGVALPALTTASVMALTRGEE